MSATDLLPAELWHLIAWKTAVLPPSVIMVTRAYWREVIKTLNRLALVSRDMFYSIRWGNVLRRLEEANCSACRMGTKPAAYHDHPLHSAVTSPWLAHGLANAFFLPKGWNRAEMRRELFARHVWQRGVYFEAGNNVTSIDFADLTKSSIAFHRGYESVPRGSATVLVAIVHHTHNGMAWQCHDQLPPDQSLALTLAAVEDWRASYVHYEELHDKAKDRWPVGKKRPREEAAEIKEPAGKKARILTPFVSSEDKSKHWRDLILGKR